MAKRTHTEDQPEKLTASQRLEVAKAKHIIPPAKLRNHHVTSASEGFTETKRRLLVCVQHNGSEDRIKDILSSHTLACVKASPYPASYYELTERQVDAFRKLGS